MDLIVECSSGFMSITGTEGGQQVRSGYAVADINAGMHSAIGILLALRAREMSGTGQYVDVAMQDSLISAMSSNYMSYLGSQVVPRPLGASFGTVVPYTVFSAQDRAFSIAVEAKSCGRLSVRPLQRRDLIETPTSPPTRSVSETGGILRRYSLPCFKKGPCPIGCSACVQRVSPVRQY